MTIAKTFMPRAEDLAWQDQAACREIGGDIWFPELGENVHSKVKRVCGACTVRTECLEYALAHDERFGIWGGKSERERRVLKQLRRASA